MPTTVPVIKGRMGTTDFYEAKMTARELVAVTRPAREMDEWANFSIEERLQRELNDRRVDDEIVPYLVKSADRYFSSIVVLIYKADISYEALSAVVPVGLPAAYSAVIKDIGFLTISGGELVILDGQHRMAALRRVIQSKQPLGDFANEIPSDELAVIFVPWIDSEHTRRLFNKINRTAKATSRGDNIIMDEDDGFAILTRWLLRPGEPLGLSDAHGDLIVNWKANTLPKNSTQFTTVSAVYESVKCILSHCGIGDELDVKKNVVRPSDDRLRTAYEHVAQWWSTVLEGIPAFTEALASPAKIPSMRATGESASLLFRPGVHIILFRALVKAVGFGSSLQEAVKKLNGIQWNDTGAMWRDILIAPSGRIIARNENYDAAADLIAYLIVGDRMPSETVTDIRDKISRFKGTGPDELVPIISVNGSLEDQIHQLLGPSGR